MPVSLVRAEVVDRKVLVPMNPQIKSYNNYAILRYYEQFSGLCDRLYEIALVHFGKSPPSLFIISHGWLYTIVDIRLALCD